MNIEQIKIRTFALKGDSTSPGESLLADAAGLGSLEDPNYVMVMKTLVQNLTRIAMKVNDGKLPPNFEDKIVDQYLAARSSKVPDFDAVTRDEMAGKGDGHILGFARQMKQAVRDAAQQQAAQRS